MGNQNRKNAIRAYMAEHGVNYTTAKRAIESGEQPWLATVQGATPPVEQTIRFDAAAASELFAALGGEPMDLSGLTDTDFYDPMKHVVGEVSTGKTFMNWMQDFEAGRTIIGVRLPDDAGASAGPRRSSTSPAPASPSSTDPRPPGKAPCSTSSGKAPAGQRTSRSSATSPTPPTPKRPLGAGHTHRAGPCL